MQTMLEKYSLSIVFSCALLKSDFVNSLFSFPLPWFVCRTVSLILPKLRVFSVCPCIIRDYNPINVYMICKKLWILKFCRETTPFYIGTQPPAKIDATECSRTGPARPATHSLPAYVCRAMPIGCRTEPTLHISTRSHVRHARGQWNCPSGLPRCRSTIVTRIGWFDRTSSHTKLTKARNIALPLNE